MNKTLICEHFSRAIATYPREATVQKQIASKMIRLLARHLSAPCREVIEFGCGTGTYSRLLVHTLRPHHLLLNDLCPHMKVCCEDLLNERISFVPGDAESLPFPKDTELITSCSALQWFESPEDFFRKCSRSLAPGGYLAFTTFGKDNLKEIRQLTGKGLPYRSRKELETALHPFFHILHSEEEHLPLLFRTPLEVLYHLKQTGVNGISQDSYSAGTPSLRTRGDLHRFCEQYAALFTRDSLVNLTYHPIYILAKKQEEV